MNRRSELEGRNKALEEETAKVGQVKGQGWGVHGIPARVGTLQW